MEIAMLVGAAVLLFGADKIPKLARGMGQAKKEFMVGQAEADIEAERLRAEARAAAEARVTGAAVAEPASVPVSAATVPPMHDATAPLPPIVPAAVEHPHPPQSATTL